jgi:hypothetical protein
MNNFFVHIIESPSAKDLLDNRREGLLLQEGLKMAGVAHSYCLAVDRNTFHEALYPKFLVSLKGKYIKCILHISAHGNHDGIALTNGFLSWHDLDNLLSPINKILENYMVVCMSSCVGFAGCKMAMKTSPPHPFFGLIGPTQEISIADTAIAFLTFYYRLSKGADVLTALEAMKISSGNVNFNSITADSAKQLYLKEIEKRKMEEMIKHFLASGGFKQPTT